MSKETIDGATAVWLRKIGDYVEVLVEIEGTWRMAIRELADSNFSHIAEGAGMRNWKPQ